MTPYQNRLSDNTLRLATIDAYTYHVQRFADFTKKPLDRATPEDVRNFQLHLIEQRKIAYSRSAREQRLRLSMLAHSKSARPFYRNVRHNRTGSARAKKARTTTCEAA